MKYRHTYHAGNFADVHKHVTLLALLAALKRKDKGFAYLETHAGRGAYELSTAEARSGALRFLAAPCEAVELREFAALVAEFRLKRGQPSAYPGSPAIAAAALRPQDRARLAELVATEARLLRREVQSLRSFHVENGDGFERLKAWLPPPERRGLIFIDPPYERTLEDFERVTGAISDGLRRFQTGVFAAWYPIKESAPVRAWHAAFARAVSAPTLACEMWLYPRDSHVALNGSGLLIVNPPFQIETRMGVWLAELRDRLDVGQGGGTSVTNLQQRA